MGNNKSKTPAPAQAPTASRPQVSKTVQTIQGLSTKIVNLEKKIELLEKKNAMELKLASAAKKKGDKPKALHHMKLRKTNIGRINKYHGMIQNMEVQKGALEDAAVNREAFQAQKEAANAMRTQALDVDEVIDVKDDMEEAMAAINEAGDAMAEPMGGEMYDEDDLLGELDDMDADEAEQNMLDLPPVPSSAVAGKARPVAESAQRVPVAVDEDDAALAELEASLMA